MKAYNLAMVIILLNFSALILIGSGAFPGLVGPNAVVEDSILNIANVEIEILGVTISGIMAIAIALMTATAVLLDSRGPSASGIAMFLFASIYWTSLLVCVDILSGIPLPDINLYLATFTAIAAFIFIATLLQMPTGGMKSYD